MPARLIACLLLCLNVMSAAEGEGNGTGGGQKKKEAAAAATWTYAMAFSPPDHGPLLTIGPVSAVYEGENYGGNASGSLTVFEPGGSGMSKTGSLEISSSPNQVTITFRGKSFTVADYGKKLTVGKDAKAYELSDATTTVVRFAADGSAKVVQTPAVVNKDAKPADKTP